MIDKNRWAPYYTPKELAADILKLLPSSFKPEFVIDICAGSGNFLEASFKKQWTSTKYLAFDLFTNDSLKSRADLRFTKLDSLDIIKLNKQIPTIGRRLVLANPPFGTHKKKISKAKHLTHLKALLIETNKIQRMEAKMLFANLSLMRPGDIFAAVLPENLFSSEIFKAFKNEFLTHFSILKLGRPKKYFNGCEVRTRIFVGVFLENKKRALSSNSLTIKSELHIIRGIDNSKLLDSKRNLKTTKEVLHFNNPLGIQEKPKFVKYNKALDTKVISDKDLLIIRVGRHAGKLFNPRPSFIGKLYSDYFFLVKNGKIPYTRLKSVEAELKTRLKGLTTRYIDKSDIESTLNPR